MAEEKKLHETRGRFKVRGLVVGLGSPNAHRAGEIGEGKKNAGANYQSIRFGVKTSETNVPFVELFGTEEDKLFAYHKDKNNDSSIEISWDERKNPPEDYQLPFFKTVSVGFDFDDKGKVKRKNVLGYDAVDEIRENLEDGDSVYVGGKIQYSTYNGEKQRKYVIDSISKQNKEVDFEDEKFKELSYFEQQAVYVDSKIEKDEKGNKKLLVTGRVIDFKEDFEDTEFVVDVSKNGEFAKNVHKKLNFGDQVKFIGYLHNRALTTKVEEEPDEFGGSNELDDHDSGNAIDGYQSELEVINLGKDRETKKVLWEKKKYKEEDFQKFIENDDGGFEDESDENPFDDDDSETDPFV